MFCLQVFVGRVAMIGFASALIGEIQTGGKGPLGQLALPIQTPVNPKLAGENSFRGANRGLKRAQTLSAHRQQILPGLQSKGALQGSNIAHSQQAERH